MEYKTIKQRKIDEPTRSLHVKIPVTLFDKVKELCDKKRISCGLFIEKTLTDFFEKSEENSFR